jgi:hypothetical protein
MIKRHAILAAVGRATGETPLEGVYRDVNTMRKYLLTNAGGAWDKDEIDTLVDFNRDDLLSLISKIPTPDYLIVLFSGHGYEKPVRGPLGLSAYETRMVCVDGKHISVNDLCPDCERRLIILDCCRGVVEEAREKISFFRLGRLSITPFWARQRARLLFDRAISLSEYGTIRIHGCRLNGSASDEYSFTSVLISSAYKWSSYSFMKVCPVNFIFDVAAVDFKLLEPKQHPELDGGRRRNWFPFAVASNR